MTILDAAEGVVATCRALAACTDVPATTTRPFLSPATRDVHERLAHRMRAAGLRTRVDMAGNLRGILPGIDDHAGTFYVGSHLDTVPDAGAFDGVLGVVLGVALAQAIGSRCLPFNLEVIGFSEEEGVRFGVPFIGSRAFVGTLDDQVLERRDSDGVTVREAIRQYGLDPSQLADARAANGLGYLEFHIEQGPVLDRLDGALGIVTGIVGQTRGSVVFTGHAAHAGTTPMSQRRDALTAAAEWIAAVEREAGSIPGLVATVGRIAVEPGASNVVAGRATATLDVRHADDAVRRQAVARLADCARTIAARRGIEVQWLPALDQAAIALNPELTVRLERATAAAGFGIHRLASGAGHDAMIVATAMPASMLFLRSPGGISHHPDESVRTDDVAAALTVGVRFLSDLGTSPS